MAAAQRDAEVREVRTLEAHRIQVDTLDAQLCAADIERQAATE